jgi:hypothetical protein
VGEAGRGLIATAVGDAATDADAVGTGTGRSLMLVLAPVERVRGADDASIAVSCVKVCAPAGRAGSAGTAGMLNASDAAAPPMTSDGSSATATAAAAAKTALVLRVDMVGLGDPRATGVRPPAVGVVLPPRKTDGDANDK